MNIESFFRPAVLKEKAYHVTDHSAPVKLNQNENPWPLPADLADQFAEDFRQFSLNRYPTVFPDKLAEKIAETLGIHPDCLIIGHGSNELIYSSLWAILGYNDRVFIPSPSFSLYGTVAGFCEASVISVLPDELTLQHDPAMLEEEVLRHQPRLSVYCNPNNPSAQVIPYEDMENLITKTNGLVWVDEAYIEFSKNPSFVSSLDSYQNLIILRTFSKAFGLAGLRLGYLVSSPEIIRELKKTKVPFTVDALSQQLAMRVLDRMDWVDSITSRIKAEKERVRLEMATLPGIHLFESDTNFFIFKVLEKSPEFVFNRLLGDGVLVRNVSGYPAMAGCLRVTIGTPEENDRFLMTMKETFTT